MANLTNVKVKDGYQSLLTTSETTSDPTTGTLQNGKGTAITALTVSGALTITGDLTVDTSTLEVDSANNRVGIGRAGAFAGSERLHIGFNSSGAQSQGVNLRDGNASASGSIYSVYRKSDDTYLGLVRRMGTDNAILLSGNSYLALGSDNTERMRIDASGNVGIGVASLSNKLEVNGNINISSGSFFRYNGDTGLIGSGTSINTGLETDLGIRSANNLVFATNGSTERMRIDTSGNVGIGLIPTSRNNTRLQIVDGIGFPATQVASSDANTLDDYEEGTFSPSISYSGGSGDTAVVTQVGRYVKIGKWVTVSINVSWVESTASGNLSITNLPFTSVNVANANFVGQAVALSGINGISGGMAGRISANSSTVQLYYGSTGVYTAVDNTHTVGGGGQFVIFTCAYEV
jgi:hypothetical protein